MDWREIKDCQATKQFYYHGKPVFARFKSILKFHAPGFAPVEDWKDGWYHITTEGLPLYSERYLRVFGFYCGLAAVASVEGCFHITSNGRPLYSERYGWCGNFQENCCTVRTKSNEYFHIDSSGVRLYSDCYRYAGDYHDGIACVKGLDGLWRHIDMQGQPLNGKTFLDLGVFHKNVAPARDERGWFHLDMKGVPLYESRYLNVEPFYNGCALVTCLDWSRQIIDTEGRVVATI